MSVNREGRGGRVGLFVRHDVPCKNITSSLTSSDFTELEFCAVICNFGGVSVCVIYIYLPQKSDSEIQQCSLLLEFSDFVLCV